MRDMSSAQVARTGSGLGITPAESGGAATTPRAPGHERPPAAPRAAGHGRLSAASTAPGYDVPRVTTVRSPGHDRLSAAQQAPGPDVPLATSARTPLHDCLSAAQQAPDHHYPSAEPAAVSVPDHTPVSPPPVSAHDRSRHAPVAAGSPPASVTHPTTPEETVYNRIVTKQEMQRLPQAATVPLLDETTVVCRAVDVLQRTLKTRQALASNSASALFQLLDEAAKYLDADECGDQGALPRPPPTCTPL